MKTCKLCGEEFKTKVKIDGKQRNMQRRKYCLNCSPFGSGNHAKLCRYGETFQEFEINKNRRKKDNNRKKYWSYQKNKREERKKALIELQGSKCIKCGYNKCIASMDFHHRDPEEKEMSISNSGLLLKWERLEKEAKKCDLLCKNCHAEVHYLQKRCSS